MVTKTNWGRKGFPSSQMEVRTRTQGRNLEAETKAENIKVCLLWHTQLLFYIVQAHLLRDVTAHHRFGLSTLIKKIKNVLQTCPQASLMDQYLNCDFSYAGDSNLCQVDKNWPEQTSHSFSLLVYVQPLFVSPADPHFFFTLRNAFSFTKKSHVVDFLTSMGHKN